QVSEKDQLKIGGLGSTEDWRQYLNSYLFNLDHAPRYQDRNQSYFGTFNHGFSSRTFANLGVNYFDTLRKRGDGVFFDDLGSYYQPNGNTLFNQDIPEFWDPGHVFDDYLQRHSSYWGIQGSATSQLNANHQFKAGGDLQLHTLRYFDHYFP